jgi:broad specificity phosphatase PhoE
MKTHLILARHGNTFRADEKPIWVGACTDLPLVEKGLAQANAIGDALLNAKIMPQALFAGTLKRTQETAAAIAKKLGLSSDKIRIDARLREIDYGKWEGKSSEEIIAEGGGEQLAAWNEESMFPIGCGWKPVDGQIIADINFLLNELATGMNFAVTSNGILRFFAGAATNASAFPDRKVATGNICVMERDDQNNGQSSWRILQWNQPPHLLTLKG